MKPVLMIHEVRDWMLKLPLENYILTFDDGLYSQFHYFDFFKSLKTEKYFFISSGIICSENLIQNADFPDCVRAHQKFFEEKDSSNYMKWSQIHTIYKTENCFIGGHSHFHQLPSENSLSDLYSFLLQDTEKMMTEFSKQQIEIKSFCFPYNRKHILYTPILQKFGITSFFGEERLAIEGLK